MPCWLHISKEQQEKYEQGQTWILWKIRERLVTKRLLILLQRSPKSEDIINQWFYVLHVGWTPAGLEKLCDGEWFTTFCFQLVMVRDAWPVIVSVTVLKKGLQRNFMTRSICYMRREVLGCQVNVLNSTVSPNHLTLTSFPQATAHSSLKLNEGPYLT